MALNIGDLYGQIFLEDKLSGGLDQAGKKMQGFGRSMLPLSVAIGGLGFASIKFATDLNASMANVATLIPGATDRVVELKDEVQRLAVETGKSSDDISGGLYQVISAFGDTSDTVKVLEINAKAAAAGLATTEEAIALTSAVTKGYGDTTAEAVQKAADLAFVTVKLGQTTFPELAGSIGAVTPIAAALGVQQEELFAGFATLTGVTGNASEVSTQFKSTLAALLKPTDQMKAAIDKLGYGTADATIEELGLVGAMRALIGTTDGSKEAVGELFANVRALPAVFALTGGQAGVFDEKLVKMNDTLGAGKEAFLEQTQGINAAGFAFKQMKEQLRGAAEDFGDKLMPVVSKFALTVIPPLLDGLEKLIDLFDKLPDWLQATTIGFFALVAAAGPVVYVLGTMTTAVGALAGAFSLTGVGLIAVLGTAGIAIAAFVAGAKLGTWAYDQIPAFKSLIDFIGEVHEEVSGLNYYFAQLEKGTEFTKQLTEAQLAAHKAWVASTDARAAAVEVQNTVIEANKKEQEGAVALLAKMNDLATGSLKLEEAKKAQATAQELLFARTDEGIVAAVRAKEAEEKLQAASDLLGQEITELAEAEHILQVATANSAEAMERFRQEEEDALEKTKKLAEAMDKWRWDQFIEGLEETKDFMRSWIEETEAAAVELDVLAPLVEDARKELKELGKSIPIPETFDWKQALQGTALIVGLFSDDLAGMVGILGNISEEFKNATTKAEKFGAVMVGVGQIGALAGGQLGDALQGIAGGAMAGMAVAGPWGAAVGGAIGLVTSFIRSAEEEVNDLRDEFFDLQGGFEAVQESLVGLTDQDLVKKIFDAQTVEEFDAAVREVLGLLDVQAQAQEALNAAVERYGFTIEELGPAMQRQELDKMAGQLLQDWKLLIASGIDIGTVITRMGGNMVDFVEKSISAGQAIPEAMRPMVEQLIASGQLLDENGQAFGSAEEAGITFAKTMSEMLTSLIEKIDLMVSALLGFGDVKVPPVKVPVIPTYPQGPIPGGGGGGGGPAPNPNIPEMQHGAIVTRPTLAVVGEAGPEAVIPLDRGGLAAGGRDNEEVLVLLRAMNRSMRDLPESLRRAQLTVKAFS